MKAVIECPHCAVQVKVPVSHEQARELVRCPFCGRECIIDYIITIKVKSTIKFEEMIV